MRGDAEANVEALTTREFLDVVACLVEVAHLVDETSLLGLLGRKGNVFGRLADLLTARVAESREPLVTDGGERALEGCLGFRARSIARERLFGALELADLQKIDVDAQLVGQEAVRVHHLCGDPDRLHAAGGAHPDAIATFRGDPGAGAAVPVGVADDLVRLAQLGEKAGELLRARPAEPRRAESDEYAVARRLAGDLLEQRDQPVIRLPRRGAEEARGRSLRCAPRQIDLDDVTIALRRSARPGLAGGRVGCRRRPSARTSVTTERAGGEREEHEEPPRGAPHRLNPGRSEVSTPGGKSDGGEARGEEGG